ncbi:MAG: hypothetical protein WA510_28990 [Acidobacteriaceae bacterium]
MPSLLYDLRDANRRLGPCLENLVPGHGTGAVATPEQMAALLSELLHAGAALRAEPIPAKGNDPELDIELDRYRRHAERLRDLLPSIHSHLLAERSRIESQRSRVQSVAAWARASRQTF